jgi:hypothetical protein
MQPGGSQKIQSRRLFNVRFCVGSFVRNSFRKRTNVSFSPRLRHVGCGAERLSGNCVTRWRGRSIYNTSARSNANCACSNASSARSNASAGHGNASGWNRNAPWKHNDYARTGLNSGNSRHQSAINCKSAKWSLHSDIRHRRQQYGKQHWKHDEFGIEPGFAFSIYR